jgi:methionyl-tRNA synthetase
MTTAIYKDLKLFKIKDMLITIFDVLGIVNKYISDNRPWEKKEGYLNILRTILEAINILGHFLFPFMPNSINKLFNFLGIKIHTIEELNWKMLKDDSKLNEYSYLFTQIGKTRVEKGII